MQVSSTDWRERFQLSAVRFDSILQKINELAKRSLDGDYIYRGEPKCFKEVSSSLYREFPELHSGHYHIEKIQSEILQAAKDFTGLTDEQDILSQLQHYGYSTNLIDFTTDINIAIFFACDGHPKEDGRVILLDRSRYPLIKPKNPANRAIAQKSVFVQPPKGLVNPDRVVIIPHDLKSKMLDHLDKSHGIAIATIYNDLHGFIRYHKVHRNAYAEFYAGLNSWLKSQTEEAIQRYTNSVDLNPRLTMSYNNRGAAYLGIGYYAEAVRDFSEVIKLSPQDSGAFGNRALAYQNQGEFSKAMRDFERAIELSPQSGQFYDGRALLYSDIGEYARALHDHTKALKLNPKSATVLSNRATTYKKIGKIDVALQDIDIAIELRPEFSELYHNRASIYIKKGDFDRAVDDSRKAIALKPESPIAHNNLGVALLYKRSFEEADDAFSRAVDLKPDYGEAYYNRGENFLFMRQWGEAKENLLRAAANGVDVPREFLNEFGSVARCEVRIGSRIPKDIARIVAA